MEVSHVLMKVLLFLMSIFSQTSADTHTLQFLYTAVTPGVNFTAVSLVDGEEIVYYDDPDVCKTETSCMQSDQENLKQLLFTVMKDFNHTEGVHTLQRRYGCERDDDGTTRGYDQYRYDGEDFLSLDLKTGTWTAAKRQAEIIKEKWESTGRHTKYWERYLENECIKQLIKSVSSQEEPDEVNVCLICPQLEERILEPACNMRMGEFFWFIIGTVGFFTIFIICVAGFANWMKSMNDSKSVLTPGSPYSSSKLLLPPEF
ncbi:hypothetical protein AMELA_G00242480 [Ameiurus melas]|uniref:MHC class I-like antigen recognition-like domain-containing protein n=1 Tax=Ameiurus melas TaxID=219545 RepID=A0A7J5ZWA3_AMEME|nr:hypothetical protein AMELA_G00242480 [Ameiurus melas]